MSVVKSIWMSEAEKTEMLESVMSLFKSLDSIKQSVYEMLEEKELEAGSIAIIDTWNQILENNNLV